MRAPIPETFSWERPRTATLGVQPRSAHVRRRTGIIMKPVSSRQIRWAPRRTSFFHLGPIPMEPFPHALIVALLRAGLRPLGTEATRSEEPAHVIGVIGD